MLLGWLLVPALVFVLAAIGSLRDSTYRRLRFEPAIAPGKADRETSVFRPTLFWTVAGYVVGVVIGSVLGMVFPLRFIS